MQAYSLYLESSELINLTPVLIPFHQTRIYLCFGGHNVTEPYTSGQYVPRYVPFGLDVCTASDSNPYFTIRAGRI